MSAIRPHSVITDINPVIFGTSGLGNLFRAPADHEKRAIVEACLTNSRRPVMFDSAGKYGAGLALESLGTHLRALGAKQEDVIISNKLGWLRTALTTDEPTFEKGVWKNLKHDAIQTISYAGILNCYEQGNQLLNGYLPQWVSIHDPDEYLATAKDARHAGRLYDDVLDAYRALQELKAAAKVTAVGAGAKDWRVLQRLSHDVDLDWVMIANSLTIKEHSPQILEFVAELKDRGVAIINSAVFHSGFLIGSDYYDYKLITRDSDQERILFDWRDRFFAICGDFHVKPAHACIQFGRNIPGVRGIALNTTAVARVKENIDMVETPIAAAFWTALKETGLIGRSYPHV